MFERIKDHWARKFFFLFFIVLFLSILEEVAHSQSIRLLIPNGGEAWFIGEEKYIAWTSGSLTADTKVKLDLCQNRRRIGTIASNRSIGPGGTVAWKWKVGQYQGGMAAAGSGYKVCIETSDGRHRDCSDRPFRLVAGTIPSLTITSPRSETVWYNENTYNITWEGEALGPYLNISLLDQHGRYIKRLFSAFNDGIHPWKVPKDIPQGTYIIDIRTQPGSGYEVWGQSEPFKIVRVLRERSPDLERKEPEKPPILKWGLPDFKIRDVRHHYQHKKVVVYFDGGLGKYKGPLVFNVIVRNSNVIINRRNMVFPDNTLEVFSLDLQWPGPQTPYLNVSVKINPDCQIKELNCNNNLYEGRIFENSTDFKLLGDGRCYPSKSIWWPKDTECCDGVRISWSESNVKNAIQRGEVRYYDPYDPNTNTLLGTAKVWIGNFSRDQGTARVTFRFVSYNGVRTVERQIPFMPGEKKFVEAGIMLNLQRDNFIEASVISRSSAERARCNIRFLGLPYDLE